MTTTDTAPEGLYFPTDITPEQLFKAMGKLRRAAMDEIERLLAFLDSTEPDADEEPSLGWTASGGHYLETPEDLIGNANAGDDREDDDEREPGEDGEASLGWRNEGSQTGQWAGNPLVGIDLEDEHDGCEPEDDSEPDVDDEPTGGWAGENQDARDRFGIAMGGMNATGQLA